MGRKQTVYILKCDNSRCRTHRDDYPVKVITGYRTGICPVCREGWRVRVKPLDPQPEHYERMPVYL